MALFLVILCLISHLTSSSSANPNSTTITVTLSPVSNHHPSSDLSHRLHHLATASRSRAHHLKTKSYSTLVKTPLFPRSYGGYSVSLRFGTPPQTIPLVMDTGSSLVWLPCTSHYTCAQCSFSNISEIKTFLPKLSSSSTIVSCKNPKCELVFGPKVHSGCKDHCNPNAKNCSDDCPGYLVQYGSGATGGNLVTDTLKFTDKKVPDFLVGCSFFSVSQPSGIAAFGRGKESLPSQMGLKKFSYCLTSHRFDDKPESSDLVLDTAGTGKTKGMSYTPFRKNPVTEPVYGEYYYLTLRRIIVGGEAVEVPSKHLVPGPDGNGGTIVDSGTTFSYMERPIFEAMASALEKRMSRYTRAADVEAKSGLQPCYDVSGEKSLTFPELTLEFEGGAKMVLPLADYFSMVDVPGVLCVTIITDDAGATPAGGPAIILGNYQQQNFLVEYDLHNQRFGFKKQSCS